MKLIRNIHKDERSMNLVRSILNIAHLMNFSTVAEGVEEAEQVKILKEAGCDEIQGWYYSRPVPAQEFTKFILAEKEDKKC